MKRPSFQFYPADWLNDPALQVCSWEAKGLWIDLLCLMHQGSPYGHLTLPNGKPIDVKMLKKMLNFDQKMVKKFPKLFQELDENGVIKQTELCVFYSKRMVEDEAERESWRARQQRHRAGDAKENVTDLSRRSSSSPSSSSSINNDIIAHPEGGPKKSLRCEGKSPRQKAMGEDGAAKDAEFETWYAAYPLHVAKARARSAYWAARKKVSAEVLLEGISRYRAIKPQYADWRYPATWLNGESWNDEAPTETVSSAASRPVRKHTHLLAWEQGRHFFHAGISRTFSASELEPINCALRRSEGRLDGFRLADGSWYGFSEFSIMEEQP